MDLGASHPAAWAQFTRLCKNKSSFPVTLSEKYNRNKGDLFAMWMENSQDLEKFLVRRVET